MAVRPYNTLLLLLLSVSVTLLSNTLCILAADSAWNGHTLPGSTKPAPFTNYYVPPGAKGYSSSSPSCHYKGDWNFNFSLNSIFKPFRFTCESGAVASFDFTGTGWEWYGTCDQFHGIAEVFIDGKSFGEVDTRCDSPVPRFAQRLFASYNLSHGKHRIRIVLKGSGCMGVDAFVVSRLKAPSLHSKPSRQLQARSDAWELTQNGNTGVNAMQVAVLSERHVLIIDKVEHNPLTLDNHPAWAALYDLDTHKVTPLGMQSNSFCAGGAYLGNGTLVNVGGNPVVADHTSSADFGDVDGLQAIRMVHPFDDSHADQCSINENHARVRMASPRWYPTVLRISDGSAMIIGGSKKGGWINNATVNNPTMEYYPPKNIHGCNGTPVASQFMKDTLNSNLFPIAISLPDERVFIAANNDAMIYDWKTNSEQRLPSIPNGVRVTYPMAGTGLLLPLSPPDYTPEVMLCGGSTADDTKAGGELSSQDPASAQCSRMVLTDEGIQRGWQVEQMPEARVMPDAVLIPTGKVVIVNGAGSGISGYGNVRDQVGVSNAANPVLTPTLYDPSAPLDQRFTSDGMPTSDIPRLYHSVASLVADGSIMIAGSNPNLDRSELEYGTEYRAEWLSPPYMKAARPEIKSCSRGLEYNVQSSLELDSLKPGDRVQVALMDFGFATHAVHASSRLVYLDGVTTSGTKLLFDGPPNSGVYPPGPGFLCVLVNDIPSKFVKVMVGDGKGPEVDQKAIENLLKSTQVDQYEHAKEQDKTSGDDDGAE